jgi:hypothetical protein
MNIPSLSDGSLRDLHDCIREAMEADDNCANPPKPYGVRIHSDWRLQADAFETEMAKRGITFTALTW